MRFKIIGVAVILFVFSCTAYSATFDLKAGVTGSGGFSVGGGVLVPFLQKDMYAGVNMNYLSLGGFTGTFNPVELNLQKNILLLDQPSYLGVGINYLLSSAKQNNIDVQGGFGAQGYAGISNKLSDTMSMLVELGTIVTQAKLVGGTYSYSMMGTFSVGLRISPASQPVAEITQPVVAAAPHVVVQKEQEKSDIDYKLFITSKIVNQGQPVIVIIIPSKDTKIITSTAIFENNKKVGFAKKPEPGIGDVWKAYYELPKTFMPGVHRIKIFLSFSTGETHLKSLDFTIIK